MKYINVKAFVISFLLGLFFVYFIQPGKKTILMYPTPSTIGNVYIRDHANNCFQYQQQIVKCPSDTSKISTIPVQ